MLDEAEEKNETAAATAEDSGESSDKPAKKSNNMLFIIIGVVVLAAAAGGAFFFLHGKKEAKESEHQEEKVEKKPEPKNAQERMEELAKLVYMVLPEMVINLRTTATGRASLLKCVFVLLLKNEEESKIVESFKPQILDSFQSHIRELNLDQLEGAAGIERLRQTLVERVNTIIAPISIQKILIKEFLTQ